ncbi:hypothetical protein FRC03_002317 [Tulasnella sp. 419]|nr:hypothetical protein FRC03_002317 [Tulasnella sp. 419]
MLDEPYCNRKSIDLVDSMEKEVNMTKDFIVSLAVDEERQATALGMVSRLQDRLAQTFDDSLGIPPKSSIYELQNILGRITTDPRFMDEFDDVIYFIDEGDSEDTEVVMSAYDDYDSDSS